MHKVKEKKEKIKSGGKYLFLAKIEVKYKDRILPPTIRFPQGTVNKSHVHTVSHVFRDNSLLGAKRKAEKYIEDKYTPEGKLVNIRKL